MFLPHPRVKVSIVGSLRDREVACSASDRQGSNFESCVWRTVSSQSSHHPQEVLLAQFSLYVHKGGLKPDSFHFYYASIHNDAGAKTGTVGMIIRFDCGSKLRLSEILFESQLCRMFIIVTVHMHNAAPNCSMAWIVRGGLWCPSRAYRELLKSFHKSVAYNPNFRNTFCRDIAQQYTENDIQQY